MLTRRKVIDFFVYQFRGRVDVREHWNWLYEGFLWIVSVWRHVSWKHTRYSLGYNPKPCIDPLQALRNIQNDPQCHSYLLRLIKSIKYSLHQKVIPSEVWGNNVIDLRIFLPITSMSMCEDYILSVSFSTFFHAFFVFAFFPSDNKLSWTHFTILSTIFSPSFWCFLFFLLVYFPL